MSFSYEAAPLTITELRVENVKRLKSVRVRPDGAVVVVGGRNAQGKSSLLDAIEMAIGGGRSLPAEPIRRGASRARIVADLGDLVIERTFTSKGSELVVKNADGVPQRSPQELLNELCARITFDPVEFERMDKKAQAKILRELDAPTTAAIEKVEARRVEAFEERTEASRAVKSIKARLDPLVHHTGVPAQPISITDLAERLERAHEHNRDRAQRAGRVENAERAIAARDAEIARLHEALEAANKARGEAVDELAVATENLEATAPEIDTAPIQHQLRGAEATNRKVRENQERALVEEELRTAEAKASELTTEIEALEARKVELLAAAKLPVPGLGFDDEGPLFRGLPLAQASQAERLRVSVAIGLAVNPRVKVLLVRDGSRLDEESLALLTEMAAAAEAQVWLERVSEDGAGCSVVIEDGEVVAGAKAAE